MRVAASLLVALAASAVGCSEPTLDLPQARPASRLVLDGGAEPGAAPLVFRARIQGAAALLGGLPFLFEGELSSYHERRLRQGDLPGTLRERARPLGFWIEDAEYVLQPLAPLVPERSYSLALAEEGLLQVLQALPAPAARFTRLFPALGRQSGELSVYCGAQAPSAALSVALQPGAVPATIGPGVLGVPIQDCITLEVSAALSAPLLAPPEVGGALLEAPPLLPALATGVLAREPECAGNAAALALGCVTVLDDRLVLEPAGEDLLWVLRSPKPALQAVRHGSRGTLLAGLAPGAAFAVEGFALREGGERVSFALAGQTQPPLRHVVLSEVLANPAGAEPDAEWVELHNDAALPAALAGLQLEDASGSVALPEVTLEPGELALLVAEPYRESSLDVKPAPGTRLIRLPALGGRGLSNSGEALLLVGPEGIVSRFPMLAAERPGVSWARREPAADDGDPSAFVEHAAPGASPGALNLAP